MNLDEKLARSDRYASYGVNESNPLYLSGISHDEVQFDLGEFSLANKRVVKIERLRLLTDYGFPYWEISYCYGRLDTGELVRVWLGVDSIKKIGRNVDRGDLISIAKRAGRFAKGIGLLEQDGSVGHVISTLS